MKKIKIHIRNNHWKEGFLPCDAEGLIQSLRKKLKRVLINILSFKVEYLIDWDDDNFNSLTFYLLSNKRFKTNFINGSM